MGHGVISSKKKKKELRSRAFCLKQRLAEQREVPGKSWFCIAQVTVEWEQKPLKVLAKL